jgi:predicted HTH domain antitoxin
LRVENVTARMSEEELDLIERLAAERGVSRTDAIREAIRQGAREELIRIALERYREGAVGMRGAAQIAGTSIAEMMAEANERGVLSNYDEGDLDTDVDALR